MGDGALLAVDRERLRTHPSGRAGSGAENLADVIARRRVALDARALGAAGSGAGEGIVESVVAHRSNLRLPPPGDKAVG